MSGQTALTTLLPEKKLELEAGWMLGLVWMFWRRDSSLVPAKIRTPDLPAYIIVIVLNMLPHTGLKNMQKSVLTLSVLMSYILRFFKKFLRSFFLNSIY